MTVTDTAGVTRMATMTGVVNELKSPPQFILDTFFRRRINLVTETIELSEISSTRFAAPMSAPDAEARTLKGLPEEFRNIGVPNIRVKKPFTASQLLRQRHAGMDIFQDGSSAANAISRAANDKMALELGDMNNGVAGREEWLACQSLLTGHISYSSDTDQFTADFQPKYTDVIGGPNITDISGNATAVWSAVATARPEEQFRDAKRRASIEGAPIPNVAIMNSDVADAFLRIEDVKKNLDNRRLITGGTIDISANPLGETMGGAIFHGTYGGVQIWEYARTLIVPLDEDPSGIATLVPAKHVFLTSTDESADRVLYYGPIMDIDALRSGLWVNRRFSKSWIEPDPGREMSLVASRPLPVTRRKGTVFTYKVLA